MRALSRSSHPVTSPATGGRALAELLLGEPEIVAWLEPEKRDEDDAEEKQA